MKKRFIAILDSGIGGLSVFKELYNVMPDESYIYFGDTDNVPYGSKTEKELTEITVKNIDTILKYDVKAIVVGCNTLSVGVLGVVAPKFNLPMFGVYPNLRDSEGNTVVFCTPFTAKRLKVNEKYKTTVKIVPLCDLAVDIEQNKFNLKNVDIKNCFYGNNELDCALDRFGGVVDTVILGCTHYDFVKDQFLDHFRPRTITSGNALTAKRVYYCLHKNGLYEKHQKFTIDFIGNSAEINFNFYNKVVKEQLKDR